MSNAYLENRRRKIEAATRQRRENPAASLKVHYCRPWLEDSGTQLSLCASKARQETKITEDRLAVTCKRCLRLMATTLVLGQALEKVATSELNTELAQESTPSTQTQSDNSVPLACMCASCRLARASAEKTEQPDVVVQALDSLYRLSPENAIVDRTYILQFEQSKAGKEEHPDLPEVEPGWVCQINSGGWLVFERTIDEKLVREVVVFSADGIEFFYHPKGIDCGTKDCTKQEQWWDEEKWTRLVSIEPTFAPGSKCPTCGSPASHIIHPGAQSDGEVQPCKDQFHYVRTPQNIRPGVALCETDGTNEGIV